MIAASKDTPFLPLKPLISRVEPEEKSKHSINSPFHSKNVILLL